MPYFRLPRLIKKALHSFSLSLESKRVLTEAATGNYTVTPILALLAGADVYAVAKESRHGSVDEIKYQINELLDRMNLDGNLTIITSINDAPLDEIDIVTNTGFVRPINSDLIQKLSGKCVIPLMWETWEHRRNELDLDACVEKMIKVYGTNEDDSRLQTKDYIGFIIIEQLLSFKLTPFSTSVLIIGSEEFCVPVLRIVKKNNYAASYHASTDEFDHSQYDAIVVLEHKNSVELIGSADAVIDVKTIQDDQVVIHVCGNVDFSNLQCNHSPQTPAPFGFMSFTTDYIDPKAVVDLHAAGLKVAEGMLIANDMKLEKIEYKEFMEQNYPAQAFSNSRYW